MKNWVKAAKNSAVMGCLVSAVFLGCNGRTTTDADVEAAESTPQEVYKLALVFGQPGTLDWEIAQKFTADLNANSNGRLDVTLHALGAIVPATKEYNGVDEGVIDMALVPCAWAKEKVPTASLFSGAVGGLSDAAMAAWLSDGGLDMMRDAYRTGYPSVYVVDSSGILGEVWGYSKKKIESVDDIRGLRMRAMGDAGAIFNEMGASVVFMPGGEIYEALQRGVLDWAEWATINAGYEFGFQEIAPYMYFSTIRAPANFQAFIINQNTWNDLPADLQQFLQTSIRALEVERYDATIEAEMERLNELIDYGVEIYQVPPEVDAELFRKAEEFYQVESARDPMFKRVYESQIQFRDEYARFDSLMLATDWVN